MGCACSAPRPYQVSIDGKNRTIYGLDQIIFQTILSFPESEDQAWERLWQNLCFFNPEIGPEEENVYRPVIFAIYNDLREKYEVFETKNQSQESINS